MSEAEYEASGEFMSEFDAFITGVGVDGSAKLPGGVAGVVRGYVLIVDVGYMGMA